VRRLLSIATLYPNAHTPRFGIFVARQMEALAARGDWDVTVINPVGTPPFAPGRYAAMAAAAVSGEENGVMVHRPRFTLIPAVGGPFNPRMIVRSVLPLARALHAAQPFDLVDAQFFYPDGPAACMVARELGLPLAIKARGADISLWGHKPYANRMMRAAAERAAGLLAVSEALVDDMVAVGLPRGKIAVHYTGLDHARFRPLDRAASRQRLADQLGIPLDGRLLATVGALIPRNGQAFAIEALEKLPDTRLALVGAGPDETALRKQAADLRVADRVHFLGSLDHELLPLVLNAAEAMVLPSASEGLANAWVEALACGTPLVITAAGGAREVVKTPAAGRIVPRDASAIATAVEELLRNPPDRAKVAQAVEPFSWEANAARLAELYSRYCA
jgi:teichuronic acid biosynthesis glycosyltransferase TuaC